MVEVCSTGQHSSPDNPTKNDNSDIDPKKLNPTTLKMKKDSSSTAVPNIDTTPLIWH